MRKLVSTILATALVLGPALAASAAPKPKPKPKAADEKVEEVTVTGCVAAGPESHCFVLKTADGKTYSFAGQPAVGGKCYTVTGTPTLGFCHQGTQLGVAKIAESPTNCCESQKK